MAGSVEVDTSRLQRDMAKLSRGLDTGGDRVARGQADTTAGRVRSGVPRRTGRLAATVAVRPDGNGYGVTYGGGLPYAAYIEKRSHAVQRGTEGAAASFTAAMRGVAASEVARI